MKITKKIKPLIISRTLPYLGGREIIVDKLIKFFSENGLVSVLTPDKYCKVKNASVYSSDNSYKNILKWSNQQNVDIINCHTFYLADLAIYLSKKLNKPLVFTLHGVFIDYYGKKYGVLLKKICNHSDKIITVSDRYRKNLSNFIGKKSKIVTIKNGIDLKSIDKFNKTKEYYRNKNKLPLNKFIIVTPARLTYIKGLDFLVRAIKEIRDKEIFFVICSPKGRKNKEEMAYKNKLKSISKNKLINLRFKYLDNNEIFEYYKSADVIVLPSLLEGISISLLESMACSKIVVATRVGGNPEIIKNNKNGYLIKSEDVNSIVEIIKKIRKVNRLAIEKEARKTVVKYFKSSNMFINYYKIFKEILYENK